jgi:hypothetical protein
MRMVIPWRLAVDARFAAALLVWAGAATSGWAQDAGIFREHHAWGRFSPESWVRVRKQTEEFDEAGRLKTVSTTETKTSLVAVDDFGCTLRVEVAVDVAGKRFAAQPRMVRIGYYGESDGDLATMRMIGNETLEIGGNKVPCMVLEASVNGSNEKSVSTISYCESVSPFVLKRQTVVTDSSGQQVRRQTAVDTLAVDMPYKVLTELKTVAYLRTSEKHVQGSSHTLEVYCLEIPGGVVTHSSKEFDAAGHLLRRSTLELIDYASVVDQPTADPDSRLRHRVRRPLLPFRAK